MKNKLTAPLKWHGGKHYLADKIVSLMPPHVHYVEPFCGGCRVLFAKPSGGSEVVNDLSGDLTNFLRVFQNGEAFRQFYRAARNIPFSEVEWHDARDRLREETDPVKRAVAFFVLNRQSDAGKMKAFAQLTHSRLRRGMNEQVSAWRSCLDGLTAVRHRLRSVLVLCRDALEVIRKYDGPDTLFYLDPPYLESTRRSPKVYAHEMTDKQHRELLDVVRQCKGKVMLSGYASAIYDDSLQGWNRHTFELPNNAAGGKTKRRMEEVLWCNF